MRDVGGDGVGATGRETVWIEVVLPRMGNARFVGHRPLRRIRQRVECTVED